MGNDTGSYIEKSYYSAPSCLVAVGLAVGTAFYSPGGVISNENLTSYHGEWPQICFEEKTYQLDAPTWSFVKPIAQIEAVMPSTEINAVDSLEVIKKMAFLAVDEAVDNDIEKYFARKPIRTKTILVNSRLHRQG